MWYPFGILVGARQPGRPWCFVADSEESEIMETNTESKESLPLSRSSFALLSLGLGAYLGWQSVGISPTLFPQPHEGIDMVLRQGLVAQNALFLALLALFAYGAYRKGGLVAH